MRLSDGEQRQMEAARSPLGGGRRTDAGVAGGAAFRAFTGLCAADAVVLFRKPSQRLGKL